MIQDIYPHKLNNQYDPSIKPEACDFILCYKGGDLLIDIENVKKIFKEASKEIDTKEAFGNVIPKYKDRKALLSDAKRNDFEKEVDKRITYLFELDGINFFRADVIDLMGIDASSSEQASTIVIDENKEYTFINVMKLREYAVIPNEILMVFFTGKHLNDWYDSNRFCGKCGSEMTHSDTERAMCCKSCGNRSYPRIMPAVIVGVTNGDEIVITKYRVGYAHNALIAGFVEIGETLEETVAREVMEEVGLKVKDIRYYKSQPWGPANDILMGYYCTVDGDPTIKMDENELKYASWVKREDIVLQPDDISLTNEMMKMFQNGEM